MKRLFIWLFTEFRFKNGFTALEWIESSVTKQIISSYVFALFKNGTEIPYTRFGYSPQIVPTLAGAIQVSGNATISVSQAEITAGTADLELRCVGTTVKLGGVDVGATSTSAMRAGMNFEKIDDI